MTADPAAPPASSDPGRWIRAALVLFPAGTILLGIASFGIWQWKKDREADRSFRYAMALKREINLGALERHTQVLREALKQSDALLAVPGYLGSTMGEENMGYAVRRLRIESPAGERTVLDAELSGKQMPREIVMVLASYAPGDETSALALASMLSIAHEVTGMPRQRTLRFATLPREDEALKRLAAQLSSDSERLLHLHVLGMPPEHLETILGIKNAGTVVTAVPMPASPADAVAVARELKNQVLKESGEP